MDVVQKTIENKNNTKSIIKYSLVLLVFIGALFLSSQNDGPSKWWARKISRLEKDIQNKDFSNFRGIDTGMNTSFSDSENTDIRTI